MKDIINIISFEMIVKIIHKDRHSSQSEQNKAAHFLPMFHLLIFKHITKYK